MTTEKTKNPTIKIPDARLSFPHLFTPQKSDDNPNAKPKFSVTFLLEKKKHAATIKEIQAAVALVSKSPVLKGKKPNKTPLRDGSEKSDLDGYSDDILFIAARNHKRVPIVNRDLSPLAEEDGKPYGGCYVNATIEIYPYVHPKSGPGVTASLRAVQFLRNGEPFGEKQADPEQEFEKLDDDEGVV